MPQEDEYFPNLDYSDLAKATAELGNKLQDYANDEEDQVNDEDN